MSLRIREIIVRAEVTGSQEDRIALTQDRPDQSRDPYQQTSLAVRFYEENHAKQNER